MTDLATRIAGLSPEQRALVEQRLAGRRAAAPLPSWPESEPAPLSSAQQRLWFLDRLEPGTPLYNVPVARRLRGPLDDDALRQALADVVGRHDALRTRFEESPAGVRQRADAPAPVPLPVYDASGEADPERAALERLREEACRPFDLTEGPLVRALLVRLASDDHLFLLVVHHVVFDGWSLDVVFRELSQAYAGYTAGAPLSLPPLPGRYADYAAWQAQRAESADVAAHLAYWQEHLAGVPALDLPTDRPAPAVRTHRGGSVAFSASKDLVAAARALARDEQTTLFVVLLAAFEVLLSRTSGQDGFAVATPVAGRSRPEFEGLAGFFVNTLAIRADLSGEVSFRSLVGRVREALFGALEHQEAPFDRVVQAVQPHRDRSRVPVAQAIFTLRHPTRAPLALAGVEASQVHVETGTSKFDLELVFSVVPDGLDGRLTYDADLFDEATAERIARHAAALLGSLLAEPDRAVAAAPMLSADEQHQLDAWNDTAHVAEGAIPIRFREQVARTPAHVAVEDGHRTWTYAALDAWSDRLAARLQRAGVVPGARVGICAERSAASVAGMLAAVKVGAAYVPLDPEYPAERLAFMAEDAGLSALLVGDGRAPAIAPALSLADEPGPPPSPVAVAPSDAAYVMYTSGSTGRPKGVVVPHRAVVRLVCETDYVTLGPDDCVAHLASPSFDAATFEVWGALLSGARLVVVPAPAVLEPQRLAETFRAHGVTTAFLTTALFNLVVREAPHALSPLRTVLFGGERADPDAVRAALTDPPDRLINAYGPTETTTFASWHLVTHVPERAASVPIGRAIAGTTLHVLDPHGAPVPVGIVGELYVGGAGLADGYLEQPDLTAERFVADPFMPGGSAPGARMYRTGDRVRRLPDGALDFLGRVDRQVKLRGFRIEPGEVEARLRAFDAVADAVATVQQDAAGARLVAFVVPAPGAHPDPVVLRRDLQRVLPAYLVPSAIAVIGEIPLTPNGKVDRRMLPLVGPGGPAGTRACESPVATVAEIHLADVWESVLGVRPTSRDDDFFDLGGHSLLAVQMLAAIRRTFGHAPPLSALFEASTLRALAFRIQTEAFEVAEGHLFAMGGGGSGDPVLFVHGAEASSLHFVVLARLLGADRPVYGTQGQGLDGTPVSHRSVEEVAAAYVADWVRLGVAGPVHLVGQCYGAALALEMGRQMESAGVDVGSVIAINQPRLPSELPRFAASPGAHPVRMAVGQAARRAVRAAAVWADAHGHSLDGLRRRIPYVDRALSFEAWRATQTRQQWLEATYDAIVQADRDGAGGYGPDDVRDAHELYHQKHVWTAYGRIIEAYEGGPFGGRFVLLRSEAHADDPVSPALKGWTGAVESRLVPGPHTPLYEPFVHGVAAAIRAVIDDAGGDAEAA